MGITTVTGGQNYTNQSSDAIFNDIVVGGPMSDTKNNKKIRYFLRVSITCVGRMHDIALLFNPRPSVMPNWHSYASSFNILKSTFLGYNIIVLMKNISINLFRPGPGLILWNYLIYFLH